MIYIHIPFCRTFCTYCGFYSEQLCRNRELPESYAEALGREYALRKHGLPDGPDTLYIGGGTPSVLPLSVLGSIVQSVSCRGDGLHEYREFTVEVNPDDIVAGGQEYVGALLSLGVNRISMGVQSFDDGILGWMNRRHDAAEAVEAFSILRCSGVRNISLDLIFGIGLMTDALWQDTLDRVLGLPGGPPEHISAYQLSVDQGSALEKLVRTGRYREPDDEFCCRQYDMLCSALRGAGYRHYEVSNFALPGHEAVHNSAYWSGSPYLGLGPGAHSYTVTDGRHVRSWNRPSVRDYVRAYSAGRNREADTGIRGKEVLTEDQVKMERIMLSLRTDTGIPEAVLRQDGSPGGTDRMIAEGNLVRLPGGFVRIPEDKFFISDSIIAEIV